jgi:hypothetical protein
MATPRAGLYATSIVRTSQALAVDVEQPAVLRTRIRELETLVRDAEGTLKELESRGVWDRLWSNNTADLARAMSAVVKIQQYTVGLFMAALQIHGRNFEILALMREEIHRLRENVGGVSAQVGNQAEAQFAMLAALEQVALSVEQQVSLAQFEADVAAREDALERRIARLEAAAGLPAVPERDATNSPAPLAEFGDHAPRRANGDLGCLWFVTLTLALAVGGIVAWLASR